MENIPALLAGRSVGRSYLLQAGACKQAGVYALAIFPRE